VVVAFRLGGLLRFVQVREDARKREEKTSGAYRVRVEDSNIE
jgi:hypothetical protein